MTVTQRLMAPGGFSVRLRTDDSTFPDALAKQVGPFDQLVITGQRLEPITGFADSDILSVAIYSGVITGFPQPGEFTGYGPEILFGTPDGGGQLLETAVSRTAGTLSQWAGDLFPSNGISAGTITNTGLATVTGTYQWCTRREAWLSVCKLAGAEYRVRPNFTVDAALPSTLFRSTPNVVVTRKTEGVDGPLQGLQGAAMTMSQDFEQYTSRAIVVGQVSGANVRTGSAGVTSPYTGPDGNALVMARFVNSPTDNAANALILAGEVVDAYSTPRRELKLSSLTYSVTRFVTPGDWIFAYDQVGGLSDTANQITYRGELITPVRLRVYAVTWPLESGMGVYVRRRVGGTVTYVDLTDWVEWESDSTSPGEVQWEVGAASRPASDTVAGDAGVATLGANPEILARSVDAFRLPGGYIAKAEMTASSGTTGTTPIYPASVSFNAFAGRRYRYTLQGNVASTVANDVVSLGIADGAGVIIDQTLIACPSTLASFNGSLVFEELINTTGSVQRQISVYRSVGTGNVAIGATATLRTKLLIEDIGPA